LKEQFSRTVLLIGEEAVNRLAAAKVAVIGVGGVGSHAAEALVRAGVGSILLVDSDRIQTSNINRQLHATVQTVGLPKVDVMADRLLQINPSLDITSLFMRVTPENLDQLLANGYDLVLDAIDSFAAKKGLILACVAAGIPVLSSMGAAGRVDPSHVRLADLSKSQGCRLARKLRKELKKAGVASGVTVVYSDEQPPETFLGEVEEGEDRRPLGSISFMPAIFGFTLAAEAIRLLSGLAKKNDRCS
jgi:tRNA A37 threonylcarbamoyladenosine dehydratase